MAYVKVKDRGLKDVKMSFISKGISVVKMVREDRKDRFRQDMLAKYGIDRKQPHLMGEYH